MSPNKPTGRGAPWLASLLLCGCLGSVGGSDPPSTPAPAARPPSSGAPPTEPTPPAEPACAGAARWRANLLGREQYINTVSDLLAFDVRPLVRFEDAGGRRYVPGVSLPALAVEQRLLTAEAIAADAAPRWRGCDLAAMGEEACAARFVEGFGAHAFRGPLSPGARAQLAALFAAGRAAGDFTTGIEWVIAGVLQSPDFLYQVARPPRERTGAVGRLDDAGLASRLSFFLWNSGPDAALLAAAQAGELRTPQAIAARVATMLADPRAARAREDYHAHWLELGNLGEVVREAREFTPAIAGLLRRSLLAGIDDLYRRGGRVDELWSSSTLFANDALAALYGLPAPNTPGELAPVQAPAGTRQGLLTHPALLTVLAAPDTSDPIERGAFVIEEMLCRELPEAIAEIPELPPSRMGVSTRQRLEQHRADPACAGCHQLFDPIGLALEGYDALGRVRAVDQGVPVDTSGELRLGTDLDGRFADGRELVARFPQSTVVRDCMVQRWFEYALARELEPSDACAVAAVKQRFRARGDLVELLAAVATSEPFQTQHSEAP